MTDEPPGETLDDDALRALLDRPFTELTVDELMAMKAAYAARGIRIYNSASIEQVVLAFLAGNSARRSSRPLARRPRTALRTGRDR